MLVDLIHRLRAVFQRRAVEREMDEELRFHVDQQIEKYQQGGHTRADAARRARMDVGGFDQVKEECRDSLGVRLVNDLHRDFVLAVRSLRATPVLTLAAVLSLALTIGANVAIFGIVNGLLLRPMPVRNPARLALISDTNASRLRSWTYAQWRQFLEHRALFEGLAAWSFTRFNVASGGPTDYVEGLWVSGHFFETLGVPAELGRTLSDADDRRGGGPQGPVAIISYKFWNERFALSPNIVGGSIRLDGVVFTVVGVTPPEFFGPSVGRAFDVIAPIEVEPLVRGPDSSLVEAGPNFLNLIARLRPGQTLESATASLGAIQRQVHAATIGDLAQLSPSAAARYLQEPFTAISAARGESALRHRYERPLLTVMVIVALVLMIACVNVANLLLARAVARRHELSVRRALGASGWRLARQLLIESLVLSSAGALAGVAIAYWASHALVAQLGSDVFINLSMDVRMLGFMIGVAAVTTVIFGTVPAFQAARVAPMEALKESRTIARRTRLTSSLIVAQVALSVVLVVGAGLFIRSFVSLISRPLGFEPDRVLVTTIDTQRAGVAQLERLALYARARAAVLTLPEVAAAGLSFEIPTSGGGFTPPVAISGVDGIQTNEQVWGNLISPGWFETFGTRVITGRDLNGRDTHGSTRVVVVNEALARKYFGAANPLGRTVTLYAGGRAVMAPMAIVGVVEDAEYASPRSEAPPTWYAPMEQFDLPMALESSMFQVMRLSVRPRSGPPAQMTRSVAAAVSSVNPNLGLSFRPLADYLRTSVTRDRLMGLLAGSFGALALVLSGVGLYGVTAYGVSRRRTEIGIRMALGATPGRVVQSVLSHVTILLVSGVAAGVGISLWLSPTVASLIYGVGPRDPITLAGAAGVLTGIGLLAGWLPARLAARIDPMAVLRKS